MKKTNKTKKKKPKSKLPNKASASGAISGIKLSPKRLDKLYSDVSNCIMDTRIKINLTPNFNINQLDYLLHELQCKASDMAVKSVQQKL